MSKIDLNLNFDEIRARLNTIRGSIKTSKWAKLLGINKNVVTNVHGSLQQKPSIEYMIAVARATGTSIEYVLWGEDETHPNNRPNNKVALDDNPEISEILKTARQVLKSGNKMAFDQIKMVTSNWYLTITKDDRMKKLEAEMAEIKKRIEAEDRENNNKKARRKGERQKKDKKISGPEKRSGKDRRSAANE